MGLNAQNITNEELFYGHKACGGCGAALSIRLVMKVLGKRTFAVVPPNCMSTVAFIYPSMTFGCSGTITPFAGTAAMEAGIEAGAKALGLTDYTVVGFAGDGGTADIGLQSLSGAIDRGDRIMYICYDNEAYMNTGVQTSGLTPYGAKTTTSPAGDRLPGNTKPKKNVFEIVAAHDIPYAATASLGYPEDLLNKVAKAKATDGPSYIHIFAPCPTGWGCASELTVDIAKKAVDSGLWYLAEYENHEYTLNRNPKQFSDVRDYLKKQGRFAHLKDKDIEEICKIRDAKWAQMRKHWNCK